MGPLTERPIREVLVGPGDQHAVLDVAGDRDFVAFLDLRQRRQTELHRLTADAEPENLRRADAVVIAADFARMAQVADVSDDELHDRRPRKGGDVRFP